MVPTSLEHVKRDMDLQSTRTLEDFDFAKGVTFQYGYFENQIVIDKFQVFQNGMLVEAKINTDKCDAFLDNVVELIGKEGGISATKESDSARFYYSNLEVHGSFSLAEGLPQLHQIGRKIVEKLREYHQTTVDYELVGLLYARDRAQFLRSGSNGGIPQRKRASIIPPRLFEPTTT